MQPLGETRKHLRLILRMGKVTGTDLAAAFQAGVLSRNAWADMVRTCRGCGWAGQCCEWLDDHSTAASPPEACANRDRFEMLKHGVQGRKGGVT